MAEGRCSQDLHTKIDIDIAGMETALVTHVSLPKSATQLCGRAEKTIKVARGSRSCADGERSREVRMACLSYSEISLKSVASPAETCCANQAINMRVCLFVCLFAGPNCPNTSSESQIGKLFCHQDQLSMRSLSKQT